MSDMKPLEAYSVISRCITELHQYRKFVYPNTTAYSHEEISAQVIAFEALRRMEEDNKDD